jgi:tetratricopeptide (TPR) repeat protein
MHNTDLVSLDVHLLIERLHGLPLALAQAGCFIGMSDIGVHTYITIFDSAWSNVMRKQDDFPVQGYERSMLTTWKISYDQVLRRSEAAAWLLRLWAFFYHDDFWYGLMAASTKRLAKENEAPKWLVTLVGSELEFSSAMGLLKAYSLADSQGTGSYTMHSVLHRWSRSLSLDADGASLLSTSLYLLGDVVQLQDNDEYWKADRRLMQHVLHASNELRVSQTQAKHKLSARAISCLGFFLSMQGQLSEAERMYCIALDGYERALGPDHLSTLDIAASLGNVYRVQGRLDEAEQMYQRALAGYEKALGPNHKSTIETVNNLGILYSGQGKPDQAEQMLQRALEGCEKTLGSNHQSTLSIINNLGNLYGGEGRLDEAEELLFCALASYEKTLGKEALTARLLDLVFSLGRLYHHQRRLDEAEHMFERAAAGYQEVYGLPHQRVAEVSERLALLRSEKGKFLI